MPLLDPPIYINVRDRVEPLRQLITWLEAAGHERIILLDNQSSWEPLLAYLQNTPHQVIRLGDNLGSRALWHARLTPNEWFVYTDPDIVPIEECPHDLIAHLHDWAERTHHPKAGPGLYIDDVPDSFLHKQWERDLVCESDHPIPGKPSYRLAPGVYDSQIDTTFALYRPSSQFTPAALRMGYPYQARHLSQSWYGGDLTAEDAFYLDHALADDYDGSTWARDHRRGPQT